MKICFARAALAAAVRRSLDIRLPLIRCETTTMSRAALAAAAFASMLQNGEAADLVGHPQPAPLFASHRRSVEGRVAVVDGRTLWFPGSAILVQLADIDSCALPQWSFQPREITPPPGELYPVPCGGLAKAWLKRIVGDGAVVCKLRDRVVDQLTVGVCRTGGGDIALQMLQVGMAKLIIPFSTNERYRQAQHNALSARYGMWATYVLDMPEWRRNAVDRTTGRRPQADFNLLIRRQSEISPPFRDARRQPARTDR
jgi:endonuclease YncB( thermonuclease family)